MKYKKMIILVFILVAAAQIYVPAKMILGYQAILKEGVELKFRTFPVDPYDAFRGKFIVLSYRENSFKIEDEKNWRRGEKIYAVLARDSNEYVHVINVVKEKPDTGLYVRAKVGYVNSYGSNFKGLENRVMIEYPFKRFYMEESKAKEAENAYGETFTVDPPDTSQVAYALINVKDGESVLKDVILNGRPILEIVNERLTKKEKK